MIVETRKEKTPMKLSVSRIFCAVAFSLLALVHFASAQTLLLDNFTLWTSSSSFLNSLAGATSSPAGTFVTPQTTFTGTTGLQMSGLTGDYTMTGLQSLATFSAPFTVTVQVTPTQGTANPFAIYIVSADLTQYLTLSANVSPAYQGFWADAPNISELYNLGEQFSPNVVPQLNTQYRIVMEINSSGVGTVNVYEGKKLLGTLTSLESGIGLFYVVIGQKIGLAPTGSQVADWSSVRITAN
jgi:hypothetical protein